MRNKKIKQCDDSSVDVPGAFTLNETGSLMSYFLGYYVYFNIQGTFNKEITAERARVQIYKEGDLIKTFHQDMNFTNVRPPQTPQRPSQGNGNSNNNNGNGNNGNNGNSNQDNNSSKSNDNSNSDQSNK